MHLFKKGGLYYEVFAKVAVTKADFAMDNNKLPHLIVLFVEDWFLDIQAEIKFVKTRLSDYDTTADFKCFAEDFFEQFNTRQIHYILESTFREELNIEMFEQSGIVIEHFPLHEKQESREALQQSWV